MPGTYVGAAGEHARWRWVQVRSRLSGDHGSAGSLADGVPRRLVGGLCGVGGLGVLRVEGLRGVRRLGVVGGGRGGGVVAVGLGARHCACCLVVWLFVKLVYIDRCPSEFVDAVIDLELVCLCVVNEKANSRHAGGGGYKKGTFGASALELSLRAHGAIRGRCERAGRSKKRGCKASPLTPTPRRCTRARRPGRALRRHVAQAAMPGSSSSYQMSN